MGTFFEDINRGADGGLYAEMVENPSFDFPKPLMGWTTQPARVRTGVFMIINQSQANVADPKFLRVDLGATDKVGLINEGFGGMGFVKGGKYEGMIRYRNASGTGNGSAGGGMSLPGSGTSGGVVQLLNAKGSVGEATVNFSGGDTAWREVTFSITAADTAGVGKLLLGFKGPGRIDIDRVSLFPGNTWKGGREDCGPIWRRSWRICVRAFYAFREDVL